MTIRLFGWRDLTLLHRYRKSSIFLDSARVLTRGPILMPARALLLYFASATGIFTYLCDDQKDTPLLGQVLHPSGFSSARLSYLAPESALESASLPATLDHIAQQIGKRGAFHMLAEVDESRAVFEALRRVGFGIYARQHVWQLSGASTDETDQSIWRTCAEHDLAGVSALYHNLVPGLVQQIEPPPKYSTRGLVYCQEGEVLAFVELKYGLRGIWAQPFVHPDAEDFAKHLVGQLQNLPNRHSRPIFLCVRSYQSWLEHVIQETGAEPFVRQAVMVRHLAATKKLAETYMLPAINGTRAEPTAPFARIKKV